MSNRRRSFHSICFLLAALLPAALLAAGGDDAAVLANLKQTLSARFKDVQILDVRPSTLPGLYEVFTGSAIAYSDRAGDHLVLGPMLETATGRNLTAERLSERNSIDFNTLPFDQAIKVVKGTGERRLAIFADPDCPYCQQLEKELQGLSNVTVYTFLYPITSLHPDAMTKARAIWCSPDRAESWTHWMVEKASPPQASCATDPIASLQDLAKKLNINATPTLYLPNGKRVDGAIEIARLDKMLTEAAASAVRASALPVPAASAQR